MVDPVTPAPPTRWPASVTAASGLTQIEPAAIQNLSPSLPRLVALADDLARQGPPIDYAKIAHIRQAIATGLYTIDFDATAAALLSSGGAGGDDD